ncbi:hypothetical protein ABRY23_03370 [Melioribacteraceae bacterium 4301-Me]|uniref:hypothetical protein n=1 Tax=Pyranulibacter aquaticus TaxID=3163344 RepID=UPI003598B93E
MGNYEANNLSENSKYDLFLEELNALEKQVYYFIQKGIELSEFNEALEKKIAKLEAENTSLKKKLNEIEEKLSKPFFDESSSLGDEFVKAEGKEKLKKKIDELIARLDFHLRS